MEFHVYTPVHLYLIEHLHKFQITAVAMESTGGYGQTLFNALQAAGFDVKLVNGSCFRDECQLWRDIDFYIPTLASFFRINIFRMGGYRGICGRLMDTIASIPGINQPAFSIDTELNMTECNWQPSYSLNVPIDWHSGVYLAELKISQANILQRLGSQVLEMRYVEFFFV